MDQEGGATSTEVRMPWHALRRGKAKIAFSIQELVALTSEFSLKYAEGCDSQVIRTDPAKYLFVYRVVCHKKDKNGKPVSDPNGHVVRLKFDLSRLKETGTIDDLDVRMSCSCPAFLYWGPQWNLSTGDSLYGAPRPKFQPPTDPKRHLYVICKHCKIVADRIGPVLERMLSKHRNTKDRAQQEQNLKDVELEKQRAQQTVEELETQTTVQPDTTPQNPNAPEVGQPEQNGPVKTWGPKDDLGDLTLPGQTPLPKKPTLPSPETLIPQKTRDLLKLPPVPGTKPQPPAAPSAPAEPVAPGSLGKLVQDQGRKVTPNLTVYDDDEGEPTVLPGNLGKLVVDQKQQAPPATPPKAKVVRDQSTTGKPLPSNIKLVDDDDDSTIKINSSLKRLMAGLVLAGAEPEAIITEKVSHGSDRTDSDCSPQRRAGRCGNLVAAARFEDLHSEGDPGRPGPGVRGASPSGRDYHVRWVLTDAELRRNLANTGFDAYSARRDQLFLLGRRGDETWAIFRLSNPDATGRSELGLRQLIDFEEDSIPWVPLASALDARHPLAVGRFAALMLPPSKGHLGALVASAHASTSTPTL